MTNLPPGWVTTTIGETCSIVSGSTPRSTEPSFWNGDVPWITPDDLSRHKHKVISIGRRSLSKLGFTSCSARMVPAGTVLYTSRAPIGYVAIAAQAVCTNQGFKSLIPADGISSDYLYWYMQHATELVKMRASGTTFAEVSGAAMATVPFALAPQGEQDRIVAVIEEQFSRIEAGVAGLERVRRSLKRMRAAILHAAVVGTLVARKTIEWEVADLGDLLLDIHAGKSFKCDERESQPDQWGVIKVSAMTWGEFREQENKTVLAGRKIDERMEVHPGDLLVSRSNTVDYVGAVVHVQKCRPRLLLSDKSLRLVPGPRVLPEWLVIVLRSRDARKYIETVATGTSDSMRNISQPKLRAVRVPLPSLAEQQTLVAEVDRQMHLVGRLQATISEEFTRAGALRSAILAAAFAGELVAQDPRDEPALAFMERVAADRALVNGHNARPTVMQRTGRGKVTA